jgi:hypothetical protein
MATIGRSAYLNCFDRVKTDICFTVDEFSKAQGYTYLGSDNGTIERNNRGILITCGPYQFGLTLSDIRSLKKRSYVQQKIMTGWIQPHLTTEFRVLDNQIEILERLINPQFLKKGPYLQITRYTINSITPLESYGNRN